MNERRHAEGLASATSMKCECECFRAECGSAFEIAISDYEAVRANGRRFLVVPGHEGGEETIVSQSESYWVIEKSGDQGAIAEELNPR
jgi:hypothetical protein